MSGRQEEDMTSSSSEVEHKSLISKLLGMKDKKKKKKQYQETIGQLTSTVESQMTVMKELTDENRKYQTEAGDLLQKYHDANVENTRLTENVSSLQATQETSKKHLEAAERKLTITMTKKITIAAQVQALEEHLADKENHIQKFEVMIAHLKGKNGALKAEKADQQQLLDRVKQELLDNHVTVAKVTGSNKTLEKENSTLSESVADMGCQKVGLEEKMTEMRNMMYTLRSKANQAEHKLEADNECLKYDIATMTKTLEKKEKELEETNRDKQHILNYYTKNRGNLPPSEQEHQYATSADDMHPDTTIRCKLESQAIDMETKLYRKSQLIEELVGVIQEHRPDFLIEESPELSCYSSREDQDTSHSAAPCMPTAVFPNPSRERRVPVRVFRDANNPLDSLDDTHLLQKYRMNRSTIFELCGELECALQKPVHRTTSVPVSLQVLLALRYFASGGFQSAIALEHGMTVVSVSRSIHAVAEELTQRVEKYIRFPESRRAQAKIQHAFHSISEFPNVIGSMATAFVPIKAPAAVDVGDASIEQASRAQYHAINVQALCDAKHRFLNIVARWPASCSKTNDIWSNSISQYLEENSRSNIWLLADNTYPIKPYILTPLQLPTRHSEQRYNEAHRRTCGVIETAFQMWKMRFRCLQQAGAYMRFTPEKCIKIIIGTGVLHNICINKRMPLPDESNEEEDPVPVAAILTLADDTGEADSRPLTGASVRERLISTTFNGSS